MIWHDLRGLNAPKLVILGGCDKLLRLSDIFVA